MKKYALIIGIDRYRQDSGIRDLNYSVADAMDLQDALTKCGFEPDPLENEEATSTTIFTRLKFLRNKITSDDLLLFAFFGHGATRNRSNQYLLPAGADRNLKSSWLPLDTIIEDLCGMPERHLVLLLDVCRDELDDVRSPAYPCNLAARDLEKASSGTSGPNTFVMYSCEPGKKCYESKDYKHSLFAKHLIDGIRNRAGDSEQGISGWQNGVLRCDTLAEKVKAAVILAAEAHDGSQQPDIVPSPIPITLAREGEEKESEIEQDRDDERTSLRHTGRASHLAVRWSGARRRAAVTLIGLTAVGISVAAWFFRPPDPPLRCPAGPPAGMNVIIVHSPGGLPDTVRERVAAALEGQIVATTENGLLEVRLLDGLSPSGKVLFSRCRPATVDREQDTGRSQRQWIADSKAALRNALSAGATNRQGTPSSLMAAIKQIVEERAWAGRGRTVQITIASNLVEDTQAYSQRNGDLSFQRFRGSPSYYKLRTDLQGAGVRLYYLRDAMNADIDPAKHINFWMNWIIDGNADPNPRRTFADQIAEQQ